MLVTIKTLTNVTFKVDLNPTDTVKNFFCFKLFNLNPLLYQLTLIIKIKEVKEKIHKEKGDDYRVENQKLILLGKVLEDNKNVGEYGITETSSIVCFAAKVCIFVFFF